ncbi:hypothetical protein BCR42DRAFT_400339 [Absidia repens]|uniref:Uncharacterized protein n=1 Tax=Absidia repens TaxID=90262 RepID=A0A1X2J2R5_9FUNG|nr:hypothetical protein BCR42DRAFT_400339 [Absidia repens]
MYLLTVFMMCELGLRASSGLYNVILQCGTVFEKINVKAWAIQCDYIYIKQSQTDGHLILEIKAKNINFQKFM